MKRTRRQTDGPANNVEMGRTTVLLDDATVFILGLMHLASGAPKSEIIRDALETHIRNEGFDPKRRPNAKEIEEYLTKKEKEKKQ